MKNYQPDYYNNFKCIADKCSITIIYLIISLLHSFVKPF